MLPWESRRTRRPAAKRSDYWPGFEGMTAQSRLDAQHSRTVCVVAHRLGSERRVVEPRTSIALEPLMDLGGLLVALRCSIRLWDMFCFGFFSSSLDFYSLFFVCFLCRCTWKKGKKKLLLRGSEIIMSFLAEQAFHKRNIPFGEKVGI